MNRIEAVEWCHNYQPVWPNIYEEDLKRLARPLGWMWKRNKNELILFNNGISEDIHSYHIPMSTVQPAPPVKPVPSPVLWEQMKPLGPQPAVQPGPPISSPPVPPLLAMKPTKPPLGPVLGPIKRGTIPAPGLIAMGLTIAISPLGNSNPVSRLIEVALFLFDNGFAGKIPYILVDSVILKDVKRDYPKFNGLHIGGVRIKIVSTHTLELFNFLSTDKVKRLLKSYLEDKNFSEDEIYKFMDDIPIKC